MRERASHLDLDVSIEEWDGPDEVEVELNRLWAMFHHLSLLLWLFVIYFFAIYLFILRYSMMNENFTYECFSIFDSLDYSYAQLFASFEIHHVVSLLIVDTLKCHKCQWRSLVWDTSFSIQILVHWLFFSISLTCRMSLLAFVDILVVSFD